MRAKATNIVEGALTFHYAVTATTNFMGSIYPLRFEFFQKGRDFLPNEGWFKQGVGRLKSIRVAEAPKGLFNAQSQQTIVDWRFQDSASGMNANTYTWTNEFTPRTDDPVLQTKFKARVDQALRHKEGSASPR